MKSAFRHIVFLLTVALFTVSCTDDDLVGGSTVPMSDDHGIGQLVLFSSGNSTSTSSRASVIPYMEKEGRFVCKMFYHAKSSDTDASPFDTISTPITSWLRVDNNEGNSVYWRNDFDMLGVDKEHQDYKDYGFDSRAQYFYWRNRLDHVFLGFTDYNKLKSNTYGSEQGRLFMYPEYDGAKKTKTGETEDWLVDSYRTLKFRKVPVKNPAYDEEAKLEAEGRGETYDVPALIEHTEYDRVLPTNNYPAADAGPSFAVLASAYGGEVCEQTLTQIRTLINASSLSADDKAAVIADLERTTYTDRVLTAEGTFRDEVWYLRYDPTKVDPETQCVDLADPATVIYSTHSKLKVVDIVAVAPANTFDLTRKPGMESMNDQPDPLIALTKMKPTGATQEANRVRLYFKHQFSQIQVNLTNAENTGELRAENIVSVELLGVTKKGYVFTNINPNGTQILPTYDPVIITQYTEEQLRDNPYGTSFEMFEMDDDEKPLTSLKSFNAIAFGQLQAIRITWKEDDYTDPETHITEDGVRHVATYKITVDDRNNSLVNLKSGYRYMYDFELRRGTIAMIRATIDGWLLHDDLNYGTSGTISE